jgi:hypothetical protein
VKHSAVRPQHERRHGVPQYPERLLTADHRREEADPRPDAEFRQHSAQGDQVIDGRLLALEAPGGDRHLAQLRQAPRRVLLRERLQQLRECPGLREPRVGRRFQRVRAKCAADAPAARVRVQRRCPAAIPEVAADRLVGVHLPDLSDRHSAQLQLLAVEGERRPGCVQRHDDLPARRRVSIQPHLNPRPVAS